jgi:polyhydroxyalkanoate synthesis regulator phasin
MSKIEDALKKETASLLEIQELTRRIDLLETAVRGLTDVMKSDLAESRKKQEELIEKVDKLENFKNMLLGALILSNILMAIAVKLFT